MLKLSVAAKAPLSTQFIIYPLYPHPHPPIPSPLTHRLRVTGYESQWICVFLPTEKKCYNCVGVITHTRSLNDSSRFDDPSELVKEKKHSLWGSAKKVNAHHLH